MKINRLLFITDYIEGYPVVASVRYSGLMKHLIGEFNISVINDVSYGEETSLFASSNLKFRTSHSVFTQKLGETNKQNVFEKMLRNKYILELWRNVKYSKFAFFFKNKEFFNNLRILLQDHPVEVAFITVPDVYGIYIMEHIKKSFPEIKFIVEVRDIINHQIGKGNPQYIYKNAEKIMMKHADCVITVSEGILKYYLEMNYRDIPIKLIRNGYNEEDFRNVEYKGINRIDNKLVLAHIGSIYKGRNISSFIDGLVLFHKKTNTIVTFHIVGILDNEALQDIEKYHDHPGVEINIVGSLPHNKALQYLYECDISVILTHKMGSDYAIPGKTFEYIGACKPILAITEDQELISFIDGKYGKCVKHNSADVANKLEVMLQEEYDFSQREQYSRKLQARKIADTIRSFARRA